MKTVKRLHHHLMITAAIAITSNAALGAVTDPGFNGHVWADGGYGWFSGDSPLDVCLKANVLWPSIADMDAQPSPAGNYSCVATYGTVLNPIYPRPDCLSGYALQPDRSCRPSPPRPQVQVCSAGAPAVPGSGTKTLFEGDEGGAADLPVTWAYQSYSDYMSNAGIGQWTMNWQRGLDTSLANGSTAQVSAQREDGSVVAFSGSGTSWTAIGSQDTLQRMTDVNGNATVWQYTVIDTGKVETYSVAGKLQSVRERNGRTTTLAYDAAGRLATVTAPSGRSLSFVYDTRKRLSSVKAPDGVTTSYGYNATGMLASVTRPDGSVRQ